MGFRVLALLALVALAGCGGIDVGGTCDGFTLVPEPSFAGSYTATFAPSGGAVGGSFTFVLAVAADGTVTGTATNPSTGPGHDVAVTGTVLVTEGCQTFSTDLSLDFAFGGEANALHAYKKTTNSIVAGFNGTLISGGASASGALQVSRAGQV